MKKILLLVAFLPFCLNAQNIKLPTPVREGGKPLMEALNHRHSSRSFIEKGFSPQMLSNLLWAAFGYNRADKRTAPSALNKQSIEIYVATPNGQTISTSAYQVFFERFPIATTLKIAIKILSDGAFDLAP